jgi:hypothetical protein
MIRRHAVSIALSLWLAALWVWMLWVATAPVTP